MGRSIQLQPAQNHDKSIIFTNLATVSPQDIPPSPDGTDVYILINKSFVLSARPTQNWPRGQISLNEIQRAWMRVATTDVVSVVCMGYTLGEVVGRRIYRLTDTL